MTIWPAPTTSFPLSTGRCRSDPLTRVRPGLPPPARSRLTFPGAGRASRREHPTHLPRCRKPPPRGASPSWRLAGPIPRWAGGGGPGLTTLTAPLHSTSQGRLGGMASQDHTNGAIRRLRGQGRDGHTAHHEFSHRNERPRSGRRAAGARPPSVDLLGPRRTRRAVVTVRNVGGVNVLTFVRAPRSGHA